MLYEICGYIPSLFLKQRLLDWRERDYRPEVGGQPGAGGRLDGADRGQVHGPVHFEQDRVHEGSTRYLIAANCFGFFFYNITACRL